MRRQITLSPLSLVVFFSLAACGAHPHGDGHHDGHHGQHGHEFAGGMKAFHDVLGPAYHMEKGPARGDKTCAGVAAMKDAAGKVAAEPKGDPAAWKTHADALSQSVDGLDKACQAPARPEVDAKLEVVHGAFHRLMEL